MTTPVTMPTVPPLARLDRVELAKAGTWRIAVGGEQHFTGDDFAAAITAQDCPAIGRPVVKLGHLDERGDGLLLPGVENRDGEPALGWVANMGLADNRQTLVADLVGLPGWLGQIAASAYPSRSIEGSRNFVCGLGHTHPFVISAVALLGVTAPGVATIGSLQDHVRALYGVAASSDRAAAGDQFAVTFPTTTEEAPVPDAPKPIAAGVTVDDVRSAFAKSAPWDMWIVEIQLDPLQLIVSGDNGETYRVPVTIGADGDSLTFGAPVEVEVTYVDAAAPDAVAASAAGARRVRFGVSSGNGKPPLPKDAGEFTAPLAAAGDDEPAKPAVIPQTDPMQDPTAPPSPAQPVPQPPGAPAPVEPAAEPEPTTEPEKGDDVSLSEFRSRLGLPDDADEAAVLAAFDERLKSPTPDPQPVAAAAAKREQEFAAALGQIQTLSSELAAVKAEKAAEKKAAFFAAAIGQGKLKPADRESWEARYDKAPDLITDIIDAISPGTAVPVAAKGYVGDPEPGVSDDDLLMLLPPDMRDDTSGRGVKVGA